jgi:large subunit ribosomal protein L17
LIKQFFTHERIKTTRTKAAAIRGDAERLITLARNSAQASDAEKVHARRLAISKLGDNQLIKRLFDEIAPRYANRPGGYTRVLKLGPRMGDSAEMVILELVEE